GRPGRGNPHITAEFPEVIGADQALAHGISGNGVTVAVIDSGISQQMNWARNRVLAAYNAVGDSRRPQPRGPGDPHGHGTIIAGIIGNNEADGDGFMGVAPGVHFADVRVLDEEGKGSYADVLEGLDWVLSNKDAYDIRVVNMSLVGGI